MSRLPSAIALLAVLTAAGVAVQAGLFRGRTPVVPVPGPDTVRDADQGMAPDTRSLELDRRACADAAYLCAGLRARGQPRVLRWPDAVGELRVRVPAPPHEDPDRSRALQQAAARGVRAWQGQPFPLRIETDLRPGEPDITITWVPSLEGTELGRVGTRWRPGSPPTFTVEEFVLATRNPLTRGAPLSALEVELAAAHEMGHALGLPHSEDPGDLMFHSNTATRLSVDDYRAVEALYRMPDGALLPPG
jgi:hypothetical protein